MTNKKLHDELVSYRLKTQFEALVKRAKRAGFDVVVDADSIAIRIVPERLAAEGADLRGVGDVVKVHNACGGGGAVSSGDACKYGNL